MGDNVVELLDVAVGRVDGVGGVGVAKGLDEPYAVVEIGDIMPLTKEIARWTIGEDVVVKIAVEVAGEIPAGEGEDDFVVELGVDR